MPCYCTMLDGKIVPTCIYCHGTGEDPAMTKNLFNHECELMMESYDVIINQRGKWFLSVNGEEYLIHILYCPFCGIKLEEGISQT